jgi:hypothetical protein
VEEGPVLQEGNAQLSGEGTIHPRATLYKRMFGPLELGAVFGFIGTVVALISTVWFTPECGYDAWWTRISGGLGPGSLLLSIPLWFARRKIELTVQSLNGRWRNPLNLRLCWRVSPGREGR